MPTSTITNTITDASAAAIAAVSVTARLRPGPALRIDDGTEVAGQVSTITDGAGHWSLALEQVANMSPTSYWEVEEDIPDVDGGRKIWAITVGATNATLQNSLTTPTTSTTVVLPTGTAATKPVALDAVRYVTMTGLDASDGLSWGTAKGTIAGALASLPASGGQVELAAGTWTVPVSGSNGLVLATSFTAGVTIFGQHPMLTKLACEPVLSASGAMFSFAHGVSFTVERVGFVGASPVTANGHGALAARPAAGSVAAGYLYQATAPDDGSVYQSDGVATWSTYNRQPRVFAMSATGNTGSIRIRDCIFTGCWSDCFKASSGTQGSTVDIIVEDCTFNLTGSDTCGGQALAVQPGQPGDNQMTSSLIVRNCQFVAYGQSNTNQGHAMYVYPSVSLWVDACQFLAQNGTGYAIQYYSSDGVSTANHATVTDCYFAPLALNGIVALAYMLIQDCDFAGNTGYALVYRSIDFLRCRFGRLGGGIIAPPGVKKGAAWKFIGCLSMAASTFASFGSVSGTVTVDQCTFPAMLPSSAIILLVNGVLASQVVIAYDTSRLGPPVTLENVTWANGSPVLTSPASLFTNHWEAIAIDGDTGIPANATFHFVSATSATIQVGGVDTNATAAGKSLRIVGSPTYLPASTLNSANEVVLDGLLQAANVKAASRRRTGGSNALACLTDGTLHMVAIGIPGNTVVTNLIAYSGSTALVAGAGPHLYFLLFDSARNLLGITADQTTPVWGVNAAHSIALGSPYTTPANDALYYFGIMARVGTPPTLYGEAAGASAVPSIAPVLAGDTSDTFGTTLATQPVVGAFTAATIVGDVNFPLVAVS